MREILMNQKTVYIFIIILVIEGIILVKSIAENKQLSYLILNILNIISWLVILSVIIQFVLYIISKTLSDYVTSGFVYFRILIIIQSVGILFGVYAYKYYFYIIPAQEFGISMSRRNRASKYFHRNTFSIILVICSTIIKSVWKYIMKGYYNSEIKKNSIILSRREITPLRRSLSFAIRAYAYYRLNAYDKSIEDYTEAIELTPKDETLYYQRALSYWAKNDYRNAKKDFEKSLFYNPNQSFINAYIKNLDDILKIYE
jgi:tetratricopeptide (TPR) repeat protein